MHRAISDQMGYQRVLASRNVYAEAATYVWNHAPPGTLAEDVWAGHGEACREEVDRLDKLLTAWERAHGLL